MASTDIMGNFSPMDELIQLIYQNIYQFVVMSSVTFDKWTVYVGMVGEAGRWWRGFWEERDVISVVVSIQSCYISSFSKAIQFLAVFRERLLFVLLGA